MQGIETCGVRGAQKVLAGGGIKDQPCRDHAVKRIKGILGMLGAPRHDEQAAQDCRMSGLECKRGLERALGRFMISLADIAVGQPEQLARHALRRRCVGVLRRGRQGQAQHGHEGQKMVSHSKTPRQTHPKRVQRPSLSKPGLASKAPDHDETVIDRV